MTPPFDIPEGYAAHRIESVEWHDDSVTVGYANGRLFGGTLRELLAPGVEALIVEGAWVIFRYHTAETGAPNTVAHVLIWNPINNEWAELYEDM